VSLYEVTVETRHRRLLLRLVLYGGFLFLGVPLAFAYVMTKTIRPSEMARPPHGYEGLHLASEGLQLRAWLGVQDGRHPAAVIVHGLGDSLELPRACPSPA
jgi:hypothetical protein